MVKEVTSTQSRIKLPNELQKAQDAINLPEVQKMLKTLKKYNLGICMPHIHDEKTGAFRVLPTDTVQIEEDLQVRFLDRSRANKIKSIPVAWQWNDDGIKSMAICISQCVTTTNPSGGEEHKTMHIH